MEQSAHRAGAGGPSGFDRRAGLESLANDTFDVLVIGGGITGAGVALDAASRGLRTAVIDRHDFASGTSSKSSKLVHGGLRYLQQRDIGLVYESLAERQRLLENAPHLVTPLPFLIPLFGDGGVLHRGLLRGYQGILWLYDLTGGLRIGRRHRRLSARESLALLPTLRADRLVTGFVYWDARADDARLTLAVLRTAALRFGATAVNYVAGIGLVTEGDRIVGARAVSTVASGLPPFEIRASVIVNATGVWTDDVRAHADGDRTRTIRPAKGVHITVPAAKVPCDVAAVLTAKEDGRSIFLIPWGDDVYVGTTDTGWEGGLDDPRCQPEDVDYLLRAVNDAVTEPITRADVTGVWAGLRPLLAPTEAEQRPDVRTSDLSRHHTVHTSPHGMVTITGGKLTTYRKMAEDTVTAVVAELARRGDPAAAAARPCTTRELRLAGAERLESVTGPEAAQHLGVDDATLAHLAGRYGSEATALLALVGERPELGEPLVPGLPYLCAEAVYAARHEMAVSVADVLSRRTRAVLHRASASADAAQRVAELIAPELGWSAAEADESAAELAAEVGRDLYGAGLIDTPPEPTPKDWRQMDRRRAPR